MSNSFDVDLEKLQAEQEAANSQKKWLGVAGSALQGIENVPTAYELLYNKKIDRPDIAGGLKQVAQNISDPWEKQKKTYEMYTAAKNQRKSDLDIAKSEREAGAHDKGSQASINFRNRYKATYPKLAAAMGENFDELTAADEENMFKLQKLNEEVSARRQAAHLANQSRNDARNEKREEKEFGLKTPYGLANTLEDAKNLKSVDEMKKAFDSDLTEMIKLREDHKGGAIWNRDDVGRGQQLSKKVLLAYKDLAKLGVLSISDENILNAIIPPDPLEYNSPIASIQGQDPVLHKLRKFKTDSESDFQNRLKNRLRSPSVAGGKKEENTPQKLTQNKPSWAK